MRVTLIDHYDSFTHNLVDWLLQSTIITEVELVEFDNKIKMKHLFNKFDRPLIFSPGPNSPKDIPSSKLLLQNAYGKVPILGICLGFQLIAELNGLGITKVSKPFHGTAIELKIFNQDGIFKGIQDRTEVARYNSLGVEYSPDLNTNLKKMVSAISEDGMIQAIEDFTYVQAPVIGLQFHPESFMTKESATLVNNLTKILSYSDRLRNDASI